MQRSSYKILSYKIKHNYNIAEFLSSYRYLLQKAIDVIWDSIEWKRKGKRLIPVIPKSREFKRILRNELLKDWNYASHYVDSAIKTAYSILNSWRKNYLKGKRSRRKPVVKRKFVRVKETLYRLKEWKLRITVKPRKLYLEFDLSRVWFKKRINWDLGELILKDDELIITFRKPVDFTEPSKKIAWDLNLFSMDGFCDRGWIRVDLKLYTLHITYENIRRKIQRLSKKKPKTAKKLMQKYSQRYRNRVKDFLHKLTAKLANEFKDYEHGFEDLDKQGMYNDGRRKHNRVISKQNWKQIIQLMSYKANVKLLDPRNSTKTCPRCGGRMMHRKGQVLVCKNCKLTINRQLNASINLYLRMWGFPPSMKVWEEVILPILRRSGVTPKGDETDDLLPMNPEGAEVDVSQGGRIPIKNYVR